MRTVAVVQGTRPEIIKNYGIVSALRTADVPFVVLDTGQHADAAMSSAIYHELGYSPDRRMTGRYRLGGAIDWLRDMFSEHGVTEVVVNGDTAASIAGALAGLYSDLAVAHVEAGLRAHDPIMIEERNRIMVDAIASDLFAYTSVEEATLRASPDVRGRVHLLGNTTVDLLHDFVPRYAARPQREDFLFVTMHRKEFTDHPDRMRLVFSALDELSRNLAPVIFPVHPRTRDCTAKAGIRLGDYRHVRMCDPFGIFESLAFQKHALAVITDSGCMQEEAYLLRTPCVTIRETTERQLTVKHGGNVLTGFCHDRIVAAVEGAASRHCDWPEIYGTPGVSRRIVAALLHRHGGNVAAA